MKKKHVSKESRESRGRIRVLLMRAAVLIGLVSSADCAAQVPAPDENRTLMNIYGELTWLSYPQDIDRARSVLEKLRLEYGQEQYKHGVIRLCWALDSQAEYELVLTIGEEALTRVDAVGGIVDTVASTARKDFHLCSSFLATTKKLEFGPGKDGLLGRGARLNLADVCGSMSDREEDLAWVARERSANLLEEEVELGLPFVRKWVEAEIAYYNEDFHRFDRLAVSALELLCQNPRAQERMALIGDVRDDEVRESGLRYQLPLNAIGLSRVLLDREYIDRSQEIENEGLRRCLRGILQKARTSVPDSDLEERHHEELVSMFSEAERTVSQ